MIFTATPSPITYSCNFSERVGSRRYYNVMNWDLY